MYKYLIILLTVALPLPAMAADLAWPAGADRVDSTITAAGNYRMAIAGFDGTDVPTALVSGDLYEEIWQIPGNMSDPALLLGLLRDQLIVQGYEIGFACAAQDCGGFDFRYALPIAQGPDMHIDLGNFHYLTAEREGEAGTEHVALAVSHGGQLGYAHIATILPPGSAAPEVTTSTRTVAVDMGEGLIARLTQTGSAVLDDLSFETGASALSGARYESLVTLSDYLNEDSARRVVLVGHTDAEGSLDANIRLSEARANSVRQFLIGEMGVSAGQVDAAGIGFLAPRARNTDDEGREANRRVEVVLIGN